MKKSGFLTTVMLSALMLGNAYAGQDTTDDAAIVTYDQAYFEKFAPVTLLDMMQRIPGVQEIIDKNREQRQQAARGGGGAENQGGRGFGSGGDQILINGKRLAGKNNNIDDTLSRVSAGQVEKIELIRGAASGLDVQSQGLVINVVMQEGASSSTTFWKLTGNYYEGTSAFPPELLLSHSGSSGDLQYMVSAEVKNTRSFFTRSEEHFNAADLQTGDKFIDNRVITQTLTLNSNLSYDFGNGSELRLNGLYQPGLNNRLEDQNETGTQPLHTLWDTDSDTSKWEIGGDYSRNLGSLGRFKGLFVINNDTEDQAVLRDRNIGEAGEFRYAEESTKLDKSEKIFRGLVTKKITESQNLEVGGEAAINNFNKDFEDNRRSIATDPLTLNAGDNVKIKENRYEIFANHTYDISPVLVLQSSLTTEFSKIVAVSSSAAAPRDTSFTYIKPRVNLRYDVSGNDQLRLTVEKKVSQLDFNNFVTKFDQRTDQLVFGNTNIRPEQIWEFSAAFEHRFANDAGSVEAEVFYRDYTDHITIVDFTDYVNLSGQPITADEFFALPAADISAIRGSLNFTSKSGNIDGATSRGLKLKGNFRLGFFGLPQAVFSASYSYENGKELDQFTKEIVHFARISTHTFTFNFRHDITEWDFSYGFDGKSRSTFNVWERNYTWPWKLGFGYSIFAEKNILNGIKIRAEMKNEDNGTGLSTLTYYYDQRRFNDVLERTEKNHMRPKQFILSIQGTF
ncbi:MAG: TonB-dependent receptor plug domain-containing protein [Alphaproteobacteria bacterium]|nr:TonB-dependent receptor plug domain-containing protein [Alphaproteobacteria bacterium]HPF46300.1 TonB-dependent receptor plug domain-containing protein [Emcibacteraceae bacterium]